MTYKEITTKTETELKTLLVDLKTQVHDLSVKAKLNQLKNHHQISQLKKDIARVLTHLHTKKQ